MQFAVVLQKSEGNARNVISHFPVQRESATPKRLAMNATCRVIHHRDGPYRLSANIYYPKRNIGEITLP